MSNSKACLSGWISGNKAHQKLLEDMGVILGTYNEKLGQWENCVVSFKAMDLLDPHWCCEFMWGLRQWKNY